MAYILIKNVPDALHQRLRDHVHEEGRTLSDFVLPAIERELAPGEWQAQLAGRLTTQMGTRAAQLLRQVRDQRQAK